MSTKKKPACGTPPQVPIDALLEIADWLLDLATTATHGCYGDLADIEAVRRYLHDVVAGRPVSVPTEEQFLSVVAMTVVALETRHGLHGLGGGVANGLDTATRGRRGPRITNHTHLF